MVSVDFKHHVYLLTYGLAFTTGWTSTATEGETGENLKGLKYAIA